MKGLSSSSIRKPIASKSSPCLQRKDLEQRHTGPLWRKGAELKIKICSFADWRKTFESAPSLHASRECIQELYTNPSSSRSSRSLSADSVGSIDIDSDNHSVSSQGSNSSLGGVIPTGRSRDRSTSGSSVRSNGAGSPVSSPRSLRKFLSSTKEVGQNTSSNNNNNMDRVDSGNPKMKGTKKSPTSPFPFKPSRPRNALSALINEFYTTVEEHNQQYMNTSPADLFFPIRHNNAVKSPVVNEVRDSMSVLAAAWHLAANNSANHLEERLLELQQRHEYNQYLLQQIREADAAITVIEPHYTGSKEDVDDLQSQLVRLTLDAKRIVMEQKEKEKLQLLMMEREKEAEEKEKEKEKEKEAKKSREEEDVEVVAPPDQHEGIFISALSIATGQVLPPSPKARSKQMSS